TSSSNVTGGSVNNTTTSNAVTVSGGATVTTGVVGTNPVNGGGTALSPTALTAGGTFNSTLNVNDNFTGLTATLNGTTVNGNAADTDIITLGDAAAVAIGNGTAGGTITNIKTLNLANATNAITFAATTTGITTVNGGTGNDTVDVTGAGASFTAGNVNLGTGTNGLTLGALTYTGTFSAGAGTDTLSLVNGTNIAGSNVAGFETLALAAGASVTMTTAQYNAFTGFTAAGTETLTFSTAGTVSATAFIENYNLANGVNSFTGALGLISVIGGTGADTISVGESIINATVAANGINGGAGVGDVLIIGPVGAALDLSAKVTGVESVNVTGGTNAAWTVINENGAGVTLNFTKSAATAINNVTLGTGGQILNVLGSGTGAATITGGSGADTINLSATQTGADTIIGNSVLANMDTVANFKVAGADVFKTGTNATTLNLLSIATADTATLA
ncbi:MAG: hypothetical protein HY254_19015, partial [Burkholderiales bacterium]|nr:hypothetical protein [Burkholderiales bacterium]